MINAKHVLSCLVLLMLSCAGVRAAAVEDPAWQGAVDQYKARAAALLAEGEVEKAWEAYRELVLRDPDDDASLLGLARSGAAGHWNQSVMAYEMLLDKYPRLAKLHVELAHIYMLMGEREAAEHNLAQARALGGGEEADALDLSALEKRYSQLQIHGRLRAGLMYDSNVNLGPDSDSLRLGNWLVRVPDAKNKESFGAYFGADLDIGWQPWRDSGWWLVGDLRGFWRGFENPSLHDDLNARESQWGRGALGIRHVGGKTLADLRFKFEIFDYEFLQSVMAMGPELTFVYALTPSWSLITAAGWDSRIYSDSADRNGGYGWAGQYVSFFFGEARHEFNLGGRVLWGAANVDDYSYEGFEGSARLRFKLPRGFELAPFASLTQEFYHGPATALETRKRWDSRWRLGAALTWHINDAWSIEAMYQYSNNESSSQLYDYRQHLVTTGVAWSF